MGARQAVFEELLSSTFNDHCSAEHIRTQISQAIKSTNAHSAHYFAVLSRFNDNHNRLVYGLVSKERHLVHRTHKLFKEVIYTRASVNAWLLHHNICDIQL